MSCKEWANQQRWVEKIGNMLIDTFLGYSKKNYLIWSLSLTDCSLNTVKRK